MADERKQMLLRLSPALWAELSRWAEAEFRSTNALVEFLLTEAVRKRGKVVRPDPAPPVEPAPQGEPLSEAEIDALDRASYERRLRRPIVELPELPSKPPRKFDQFKPREEKGRRPEDDDIPGQWPQ